MTISRSCGLAYITDWHIAACNTESKIVDLSHEEQRKHARSTRDIASPKPGEGTAQEAPSGRKSNDLSGDLVQEEIDKTFGSEEEEQVEGSGGGKSTSNASKEGMDTAPDAKQSGEAPLTQLDLMKAKPGAAAD